MNIGICFGTRPEYLKVLPIINELIKRNISHKVYYILQHVTINENISDNIIRVELPKLDNNRLNEIGSGILSVFNDYWDTNHTHCIVQGDTSTGLFCSINAFHIGCKVIHIEAGLRTYTLDQPFPEEANRQLISRISSYNFTPHEDSSKLLYNENVQGKIFNVGNTCLDLIKSYNLEISTSNSIIVTFHRRENWNKLPVFIECVKEILNNSNEILIKWCMHPNPVLQQQIINAFYNEPRVELLNPPSHSIFTKMMSVSKYIITDSGGIQEEASFLGKQCIVLRESTERSHIPYPYIHLLPDISKLAEYVKDLDISQLDPCLVYGDGTASKKIIDILSQ